MSLNNPAGRLHAFLRNASGVKDPKRPAIEVWSQLLEVNVNDDLHRLFSRMADVMALPPAVSAAMHKVPGINPSLYLAWVGPVSQGLKQFNFSDQFSTFVTHIDANTMNFIAICDGHLTPLFEAEIPQESLSQIRAAVDNLFSKLRQASEIDADLREFITRHVDIIRCAIDDYALKGVDAIREGAERTVGMAMLRPDQFKAAASQPAVGKHFKSAVAAFIVLAATYPGGKEMLTDVAGLLPGDVIETVETAEPELIEAAGDE